MNKDFCETFRNLAKTTNVKALKRWWCSAGYGERAVARLAGESMRGGGATHAFAARYG